MYRVKILACTIAYNPGRLPKTLLVSLDSLQTGLSFVALD